MLSAAVDSAKLFFTGRLFRDGAMAARQLALGVLLGAVVTIAFGTAAPPWLAALLGGAAAGFAQPLLFKDLKYH